MPKEERIYIGWETFAALDAWDSAFKSSNIPLVFYDTLFQYGVERFYVPKALIDLHTKFVLPDYLTKRIQYISNKKIRKSFDEVFYLFRDNTLHTFPKRLELASKVWDLNYIKVIEEILGEKSKSVSPDFCAEKNLLRTTWFLNELLIANSLKPVPYVSFQMNIRMK